MQESFAKQCKEVSQYLVREIEEELGSQIPSDNKINCPWCNSGHKENKSPALTIYPDSNSFFCWSCQISGDCVDYVAKVKNLTKIEALKVLQNKYGILNTTQQTKKKVQNKKPDPEQIQENGINIFSLIAKKNLQKNTNGKKCLELRGVSGKTLEQLPLGIISVKELKEFCQQKKIKLKHVPNADFCFTFPRSDYSVGLRFINSKALETANLKEIFLEDGKAALGSQDLFTCTADFTQSYLIITEGELDSLSFYEIELSSLALGSVANVKKCISFLIEKKYKGKIYLALDNDKAGKIATKKFLEEAKGFEIEVLTIPEQYKDINEYYLEDKESFNRFYELITQTSKGEYMPGKVTKATDEMEGTVFAMCENMNIFSLGSSCKISTGFKELDKLLNGGLENRLYTIGACSGAGKSALCLQIADQIAEQNIPVIYFSLEMPMEEQIKRSLSRYSLVDFSKVLDYQKLEVKEREQIDQAFIKYRDTIGKNLYFKTETRLDKILEEIKLVIENRSKKPVVIIDYLQLIKLEHTEKDIKIRISEAIEKLKQFSMNKKIPIIIISALNREGYKKIELESFKESGKIEYSSDLILGMYKMPSEDKKAAQKHTDLITLSLLKNRSGKLGAISLEFKAGNYLFK